MDIRIAKETALELLSRAKAEGATALSFTADEFSFSVEFAPKQVAVAAPAAAAAVPAAAEEAPEAPAAPEVPGTPVRSPIVGTYYAAPDPQSPPFATVGQEVKKGDTLCIIEAMKMLNEITAPCDGKIARIFCQNGDLVEYDQVVMAIQ
ncbi:acetyl-CoA carboxylase biotin carboxyl carrier protein [Neobittarella massiliensis]|uniref:Biotin carboxyl carrier protein of acetyl-CoA carboxylase n=1 Tax=Neobittarella massiliensis (ex Bilen et al. 2018) TaxID=2041842 RepID=A0A8J6M282_9FIRM|nr:acetyl-CoA carboxylase biotin carboxyl carrier protein subunit [Neobittarella massiliensis]MBC3517291.1 acetyl-CoA carboxylase biotin carboxyl carrier protein [Neobittarella massiliensis]